MPQLSVIIPTKNESNNIVRAIGAFDANAKAGRIEVIVVDNSSSDDTASLARKCGALVFEQGPERCAQRNRGWREAKAAWVMFVDADMEVPRETQDEILEKIAVGQADAMYVREMRVGGGFRIRCRNFERSFYNATCIDALRVIRRDLLERTGGYDENLTACEDWDLDLRLAMVGAKTLLTEGCLYHHEELVTLAGLLAKKSYYAGSMNRYLEKWRGNAIVRRQFSPLYRYAGVFLANGGWMRILRHPVLFAGVMFERFLVGLVWLSRIAG